ncbi:uncharacterized protein BO97DRAFT_403798 [Aspergillus homomorphus CBS 101889]|uniref:ATP phosphoribosyltransferase n=1 Tax=Aspergillus homomorphus (strain CBS 101889) TaxID=1450537 RepID=A0A395I5I8_ASPHC|nr:hypothetical protein BO97DRAFT_403798 [Aspergillus homomorphus CBS 101889]RAL15257.1 hypothetical protein BO97DRAFT_403798 [Aspergillus homomorphus CBS 101889]
MMQPLMPMLGRPASRMIVSQRLRHSIWARSTSCFTLPSQCSRTISSTSTIVSALNYRYKVSITTSRFLHIHTASQICQVRTMATEKIPDRYKLVFFVPHTHLDVCKDAIFATGAGTFPGGKYSKCCFQSPGTGQFLPGEGANPAIGSVGDVEYVDEMKVEIMCLGRSIMLQAVEALVKAHPYEEVAYEVYKMENV